LALFAAGLFIPSARGDIAPPAPKPKKVAIKVEVDENAKESRLVITQGTIVNRGVRPVPFPKAIQPKAIQPKAIPPQGAPPKAVPPQADPVKDEEPVGELPGDVEFIAEGPAPSNNNLQMVVVGFALAMGLTFGGLWLARKRPSGRNLALLLTLGAALAAGGVVMANRAPPPPEPKAPPQPAALLTALEGDIQLEVVPGNAAPIRLVLTKADYEKLKGKPKPAEARPAVR
jgi:hypothetical protein